VPALPGVRVDSGVTNRSVVGVHYDPMLAKVIAHGPTREDARRRLARALAESQLHGVTTNRDLLVGILREAEFRAGRTDTAYLTRHDPVALAATGDECRVRLHALAAALAGQVERRQSAPVLRTLPSGWRNVPSAPQHAVFVHEGREHTVSYQFDRADVRADHAGEPLAGVVVRAVLPNRVDIDVAGVRRAFAVHRVGDVSYVDSCLGATTLTETPRFPDPGAALHAGSLLAPMPGTVVRVAVAVGDTVAAGTPVVVLEAMKMEHAVHAPHAGTVTELDAVVGAQVDTGAVLAVVAEEQG